MSEQVFVAPVPVPAEHPSPLSPRGLRDLFLRPGSFFARPNLTVKPAFLIAIWIVGAATVIQRIDYALIAQEFGVKSGPSLAAAHSWPVFWVVAALFGVLHGWLVWLVGGWWYWIRVGLSSDEQPDAKLARGVYTYQNLVADLPELLFILLFTFFFTDYAAAQDSEQLWTFIPAVFFFWSLVTSFFGVTAAFPKVSKVKAALWFVVAPLLFYTALILVLALGAVLYGPES